MPSLLQDPCLPLLPLEQNFDQRQMYLRLRLKRCNYGNTRGTSLYAHLYLSGCPGSCNSGKHFNEALIKSAEIFFNNVIWLLKIIFIIEDMEIIERYKEVNKNHP